MMRRGLVRGGGLVLALAAVCGCGTPRVGTAGPDRTAAAAVAPADGDLMTPADVAALTAIASARAAGPVQDGYRIGPDDLLDVRIPDLIDVQSAAGARLSASASGANGGGSVVAGAPEYQQGLRVSGGGEVSIPTIGRVRAVGLTPTALEAEIGRRLVAAGILRAPKVSVQVAEYRSGVVAVIGSVERPGLYPVTRPRATLTDMIWNAGGPSKDAGRIVAFTAIDVSDANGPIFIDLAALGTPTSPGAARLNPEVRTGDVISVAGAGSVLVDGWVERPGSYPVTRGLTLGGAVAAAGGAQFSGDRSRTVVRRVTPSGGSRTFAVDLTAIADGRTSDVPMADGDVVHVPASVARIVPWSMWTIAREMIHVGGSVLLF
jgi:polysaccharide biosynthesis/export protein